MRKLTSWKGKSCYRGPLRPRSVLRRVSRRRKLAKNVLSGLASTRRGHRLRRLKNVSEFSSSSLFIEQNCGQNWSWSVQNHSSSSDVIGSVSSVRRRLRWMKEADANGWSRKAKQPCSTSMTSKMIQVWIINDCCVVVGKYAVWKNASTVWTMIGQAPSVSKKSAAHSSVSALSTRTKRWKSWSIWLMRMAPAWSSSASSSTLFWTRRAMLVRPSSQNSSRIWQMGGSRPAGSPSPTGY